MVENNLEYLRETLGPTIISKLEKEGYPIEPEVKQRICEVLEELFKTNRTSLAKDFSKVKTGGDMWRVSEDVATNIVSQMVENVQAEQRDTVMVGDLYLAMLNFRKIEMWPWTGEDAKSEVKLE